jgi:hypothetical protein
MPPVQRALAFIVPPVQISFVARVSRIDIAASQYLSLHYLVVHVQFATLTQHFELECKYCSINI